MEEKIYTKKQLQEYMIDAMQLYAHRGTKPEEDYMTNDTVKHPIKKAIEELKRTFWEIFK